MPRAVKMPECEKIAAAQPASRAISEFLQWLDEQGIELAVWRPLGTSMLPITEDRERLLARHFGIDLAKVENERRALLKSLR